MNLISKGAALAAISVVADEVKPLNGYYVPGLLGAIAERYEFAKVPSFEEALKTGAKFQEGRLISKNINITELMIFNDALTVTTFDTNDSEVIVTDFYAWLMEKFGFRNPTTKPVRVFQSDLIVEFDNAPENVFDKFLPLIELVQKETESINGLKKHLQFSRFDFGTDPNASGPAITFLIERRMGHWKDNRYFCKANMQTDAHLRTLDFLDKILGESNR